MEKLISWFKSTGLTNLGYGVGFVAAMIFGLKFFAGAALGIFVYVNFNVIRKLISEKIK